MSAPLQEPIGRQLARTAKAVSRAFAESMTEAGGSVPTWLVLLALRRQHWDTQAALAAAVGVSGPTLTHHLDGMERDGLVTRRRDTDNRRVQVVELTPAGEAMFHQLRDAAAAHDARLRRGLTGAEVAHLRDLLARLDHNVDAADA